MSVKQVVKKVNKGKKQPTNPQLKKYGIKK